jgi:hypothetical protein
MTTEEAARLQEIKSMLIPLSERLAGPFNDAKNSGTLERYPLDEIGTPALVIASPDDPTQAVTVHYLLHNYAAAL